MKKQKKPKVVAMKPVKCPICLGSGRVYSEALKTKIKCKGCEGRGWVEVHYAEVVPAPKMAPIQIQPSIPNTKTTPYKPEPWMKPYPLTTPPWEVKDDTVLPLGTGPDPAIGIGPNPATHTNIYSSSTDKDKHFTTGVAVVTPIDKVTPA